MGRRTFSCHIHIKHKEHNLVFSQLTENVSYPLEWLSGVCFCLFNLEGDGRVKDVSGNSLAGLLSLQQPHPIMTTLL